MNGEQKHIESAMPQAATRPPEKGEQRWLRYPDLAIRMGVCERTIRRDVDDGKLPKPIKIRGCVCFDRQEVDAALTARKQN
jgi:predicted DNA-binding transcriptional regulator AlpA